MKKNKILVADDNVSILKPITLLLETAKYEVETVMDGLAIVDKIKQDLPDLLLLDVSLVGADGREICQQLKKDNLVKHIPIILMSAHSDVKKMAQLAGADDFIIKPFDISHLLDKIVKYLGKMD